MKTTPNLSAEFHPYPKPGKKGKKAPTPIKSGAKVKEWNEGREKLKAIFRDQGITSCELQLQGCKGKLFWSFAHIKRRIDLSDEEIVDPHFVVYACGNCHDIVDNRMQKEESYELLENIVKARGW